MKWLAMPKILDSLDRMEKAVTIDPGVVTRAHRAVQRMVAVGAGGALEMEGATR